jgi:hypothetical protein
MRIRGLTVVALLCAAVPAAAQSFATQDPVLRAIWQEGMEHSRTEPLAQALMDSIGPRLTGSPAQRAGNEWLVQRYREWGIEARNEKYGTWRGWRRGPTHIDLVQPRVRSLEGTMLAWSPGTKGAVEAGTVALPALSDAAAFSAWLPAVKGKFVLISYPQSSCRPDENLEKWATGASLARMRRERAAGAAAWQRRIAATGENARTLTMRLEAAGAVGILANRWSEGWGVDKVFDASTTRAPVVDLSCEDYGLVFRLTENAQGPVIRLDARAEALGEVPVFNTIAVIPGTEKPDEYVMLSAHFDSWDGGSGATDNGTGTVTMLEAMRILKTVYPRPKRTIIVGHWSGEEQGLIGSNAFAADHPEIVKGLQVLFNQDNGTGRVSSLSMQGFLGAGESFAKWLSLIPQEITQYITLSAPGMPSGGGSDNASFVCRGAPGIMLSSLSWDYGTYTWHTNRDTYDKIAFDDVRNNATLTAMLAYLASEDADRVPRDRRSAFPVSPQTGQASGWPECRTPPRSWTETQR